MKTQFPNAPAALYMSEPGEFACLPHAPNPGSDTWYFERWHAVTPIETAEFEREIGRAPACETCAAERRNR